MGTSIETESGSGAHARRLGRYALLERLEAHGTVQPFIGRADGEVELRVVKRLLPELAEDPSARARFQREALVALHLRHPNVVGALESDVDGETFFLVTEWVRGVSLHAVLARLAERKQRVPLEVFAPIALRVLDGIGYAHAATDRRGLPLEVVHRDLAPRSVLLSFSGEVKIANFGVVRASVDDFRTRPGVAVGEVRYMSPEQATGASLDRRSDLYTLGAVFYALLASRPLIPEGPTLEVLRRVAAGEAPPLAKLRPDLPPGLVLAVQRALAVDPEERWTDAASFARGLAAHLPTVPQSERLLSRFVRKILPEREAETMTLLSRIRDNAAALEVRSSGPHVAEALVAPTPIDDRPQREVATEVVRRRALEAEVPPEPSVMTMPGAPVVKAPPVSSSPAPRMVSHSAPPMTIEARPRASATKWIALAAGGLAVGLVVAAWYVTRGAPRTAPETKPAPAEVAHPVVPSVAPKAAPEATQKARSAPAPSPTTPAPSPVPAPRRAARRAVTAPPPAPVAPPPAPPEPVAPATPRRVQSGLRRQVRALAQQPKDYAAFSKVHGALVKAAAGLPPGPAREVGAMLDAAERAYDVELLEKALLRIERAR